MSELKISNTNKKRNYGIDCLRIVSMIMILILHILGHGGVIAAAEYGSSNYWCLWLLETFAYCAVNCYALISGYVSYKSKAKLSSLIKLTFTVLFYTILSTIILYKFVDRNFSLGSLLRIFVPFGFGNNPYWYFTAYFCLFFFQPYLNILIAHINRRQHKNIVLLSITLFSLLPFFMNMDLFNTLSGYSVIWLAQMYIIGSYISKYNPMSSLKKTHWSFLYVVSVLTAWGLKLIFEVNQNFILDKLYGSENFITYASPFILLAGISLLMVFSKINFNKGVCKLISFFAPMAFSVYLIHCAPLVWNFILKNRFSDIALSIPLLVLFVVTTAVVIWLLCSIIDLLRIYLFKMIKIENFVVFLEKTIKNFLCKIL